MGCCTGCGQVILVCVNIILSLVGGVLFSVACVVQFGSDLFDKYFTDAYDALMKVIEDATGEEGDISNLDFGDLLGESTIAFMAIGLFFFFLGIFGCIGGCCKIKCMLVIYSIVLIVLFIAEVVFVVLLFTIRDKFDNWVRDPLVKEIKNDYTGTNGTDGFTVSMNFLMHELKCCGIEKYTDFENATKWHNSANISGAVMTLKVPLICCKNSSDAECAVNPSSNNSFIDTGCYQAVADWLEDHSSVLIGVGAGVAAVQLLLIIFAFVTCCSKKKDDDDDNSYREDIPIQPYREEPSHHGGHNGPYHDPRYGHKQDPYDGYRGYPRSDDYPPYRGSSGPYHGPPADYRPQGNKRGNYQDYR